MAWLNNAATRDEVLANLPNYQAGFNALYATLWQLKEIPAQTLELCRLRIAQLHRCELEWQREELAIPPAQREALQNWPTSALFNEAQQACLAFTEIYTMDPQAISDEQADAVKKAYGEAGLVALIEALGLFYGLTRLTQLWGLTSTCEGVSS
ncbi:hypothetical protein H2508_14540 [Parahaliea sp. F7430]|uniref:Carboxymuconolactone decarboxylase family protein n=1 Tax=Sediminihaliea albiluteola TaxID=2758564 RepID=A0A7W2TYL9_9GAMM|nr:hypothetical protein [Sediminihaliea albiluteola]MBA6414331.1 hypothetical protein [Sediminihaliea albiluteola]